jgi:multidrug efflux pump subunit AcrA (membrane-fusion protein)
MHKRFTFWLALAGVLFAVRLVMDLRKPPPPAPPVAEPARAPYQDSIGARGMVESIDENIRIAPALAALVAEVRVQVGDIVKAGDPLFLQDQREAKAIAAAEQARVAALAAQLRESEVALADREDQARRVEELSRTRVASEDERQRARFAVESAKARIATMRAELSSVEAQLARSRVQLDLLTVRAPRDAKVLQVNIRPGEFAAVNAPEPPILLGQTESLQLRAEVDEDNASRVDAGAPAVAFLKGNRDFPIELSFVRIEPYIVPKRSLTGESSERVDTRVLQVIYRFPPPSIPVYVGQQMDVFIQDTRQP